MTAQDRGSSRDQRVQDRHFWIANIDSLNNNLYYNSPMDSVPHLTAPHLCGAYFWSLQTEFWADRSAKCLKMFHLTYFLYYKVLAL